MCFCNVSISYKEVIVFSQTSRLVGAGIGFHKRIRRTARRTTFPRAATLFPVRHGRYRSSVSRNHKSLGTAGPGLVFNTILTCSVRLIRIPLMILSDSTCINIRWTDPSTGLKFKILYMESSALIHPLNERRENNIAELVQRGFQETKAVPAFIPYLTHKKS